jgi:hypothetical protein
MPGKSSGTDCKLGTVRNRKLGTDCTTPNYRHIFVSCFELVTVAGFAVENMLVHTSDVYIVYLAESTRYHINSDLSKGHMVYGIL